ncbi:MAG TPA: CU044_2847 family protein [Terriglobales bacterium]|nr:CU044_2847 family protein [Terriglobales bacterium]
MKTVSTRIESIPLLIEAISENVEIIGTEQSGRRTKTTSIEDQVARAYADAKETIAAIAKDIGTQLNDLTEGSRPGQVELEFSMGFSASAGVWVLTAKGESTFKVKMTWEGS